MKASQAVRWGTILVGGAMLFAPCQAQVFLPGMSADVSQRGIFVDYPGGGVEVSRDGVFVDAPGVNIDIEACCSR